MDGTTKKRNVKADHFNDHLNRLNLLIVTATKVEKETLHNYLKPLSQETQILKTTKGINTYYIGTFGRYNAVHVSCDDMGGLSPGGAINTTTEAINFWQPKVVIMAGIAFAAEYKQEIGEVLVSKTLIPYENKRQGSPDALYRGNALPSNVLLYNRFKNIDDWDHQINSKTPKINPGEILSGEKLVDNIDIKKELLNDHKNAIGGDMEGYGVHSACSTKNIPCIVVKAVCDYGDGKKKYKKKERQKIAAESSINLCHHVFNCEYIFDDLGLQAEKMENKEDVAVKMSEVESEKIVTEILEKMNSTPFEDKPDAQQLKGELIRAFIGLGDVEKLSIAKKMNVFDESLVRKKTHELDKEIFGRIDQKKSFYELWENVHQVKPFPNKINPFKKES